MMLSERSSGSGAAESPTSFPRVPRWRALAVEDDPYVRDLLVDVLTGIGCSAQSASRGDEALTLLSGKPYDLLLIDVVLPDMPAWEVIRVARDRTPAPVVIIISGRTDPDDPQLRESGAALFLPKPIRVPELVETLRVVLARRQPAAG